MKTSEKFLKITRSLSIGALSLMVPMILLSGCDKGRDGRPGRAYLSLEWEVDRPDFIDAGTPDIPAVFKWGETYRAYPGWYTLYYEGKMWNGIANAYYAWEIDYEIWYEHGSRGDEYYHGRDGRDNYFTLVCSPYGPIVDRYATKALPAEAKPSITALDDGSFEVVFNTEEMGMKAVYRPVEPRSAR